MVEVSSPVENWFCHSGRGISGMEARKDEAKAGLLIADTRRFDRPSIFCGRPLTDILAGGRELSLQSTMVEMAMSMESSKEDAEMWSCSGGTVRARKVGLAFTAL
jgi:hypothetical protein